MPFNINHMTPVLFGVNMSLRAGNRLRDLGCTKVLCVYDQGIKKAGIPDKIINNMKALGMKVVVYEGVQPDPPDYTVEECADVVRKADVDAVVAIGGGSSMDTAKAANLLLTNPSPINRYMGMVRTAMKPGKTLILMPTTSGTGSEVTIYAVLTDSTDHKKKGPAGPLVRATLAIVDPMLTVGMPPSVTADTGMDAFCQSAESLTAGNANPNADILAEKSIALVSQFLPRAVDNGKDIEARTQMSFAATLSGYAFVDSNTHLGHCMGHTLGELFHIPHGNACAVTMPEILEFLAETSPDGVRRIGMAMGLKVDATTSPKVAGRRVREGVIALSKRVNLRTLKENKIKESDLDKTAGVAANQGLNNMGSRRPDKQDWVEMLQKAYER
ncbi:MAG TPA: iron-containing alcohol dehydrogenase [Candidatus Paceibacterota bacterium]